MARRRFDLTTSGTGSILDARTGKPAQASSLPVICERELYYRKQAGLEQKALAKLIDVTPNTISNWENGRSRPDVNLLPALCRALDITFYELFGMDEPGRKYTQREQELISRYDSLNNGHRYTVDRLLDALARAEEMEGIPDIRCLTYYERRLAAGIGDPSEFEEKGTPLYVYPSPDVNQADCVFSVSGNSMEPDYRDKDLVLVKRITSGTDIRYGEIGAFIIGNETYIKQYEADGLHSLNPAYKPMHFGEEEKVYLIGKVIGVLDPKAIASDTEVARYLTMYGDEPHTTS